MADWYLVNDSGVWCNWCSEMMFAPWFDEYEPIKNGEDPRCCPECGGDKDGPF